MNPTALFILISFFVTLALFTGAKHYLLYRRLQKAFAEYHEILNSYHNTIPLFLRAFQKHIPKKTWNHLWSSHNVLHLLQGHLMRENFLETSHFIDEMEDILNGLRKKPLGNEKNFSLLYEDLKTQHQKIKNALHYLEIESYLHSTKIITLK